MKKSIGQIRALYPMPLTVLGVQNSQNVNWVNITHSGIVGENQLMVSLRKKRYTNEFIGKGDFLSINLIDRNLLSKADYVGMVSGKTLNKSDVFNYYIHDKINAPIITESPLSIVCKIIDIYETENHYQYILNIEDTLVEENILGEGNKVDYAKFKPVLFEMENWIYLETGNIIGKCCSFGKDLKK